MDRADLAKQHDNVVCVCLMCVQMHVSMLPLEVVAKHWQTPCNHTGNAQELECCLTTLHHDQAMLQAKEG